MKARVKATGEIVEINESSTIYDARMCQVYNASELENVSDIDSDYWTRLEHQYAGMAMQGILSNPEYLSSLMHTKHNDYGAHEIVPDVAVRLSHALVKELKEKEESPIEI